MLKDSQMSMQEIAGFLLSDDNVTDEVTDRAEEMISVTDSVTETPQGRKRGRPPKAEGTMTPAERARRYRQKHRLRTMRRVELSPYAVRCAEKIAAETGYSLNDVFSIALTLSYKDEHWDLARRRAQQPDA